MSALQTQIVSPGSSATPTSISVSGTRSFARPRISSPTAIFAIRFVFLDDFETLGGGGEVLCRRPKKEKKKKKTLGSATRGRSNMILGLGGDMGVCSFCLAD